MKKGIEKTGRMLLICLCMGLSISCTSGQGTEDVGRTVKETSTEQKALPEEDGETQEEEFSPEKQMKSCSSWERKGRRQGRARQRNCLNVLWRGRFSRGAGWR